MGYAYGSDQGIILVLIIWKASALYSSFYEFDEDEACRFDSTIAKEHLVELKELITKIKNRLNIINDGSFELSDMITDQLRELER